MLLSSSQPDLALLDRLHVINRVCLAVAGVIGMVVLAGWYVTGIAAVLPSGWWVMQAGTAVGMLLAVASLLLSEPRRSNRQLTFSAVLAGLILMIACTALFAHLSSWDHGIVSILIDDPKSGLMSLQTALFLALLSVMLLAFRVRKSAMAVGVDVLAVGLVMLVSVILAGYSFDATHLFGQSTTVRTSPHTMICMLLLVFVTVNRRTEYGYFSVLVGIGIGSRIARMTLPFTIVMPFLLIVLTDYSTFAGWLSEAYALALMAAVSAVLVFLLLVVMAWRINDLERDLRDMSLTDDLTKTYNLRGLQLLGEQAMREARRMGAVVTVLFIDLDGLKQANDTYGHEVGSRFLMDVADLLRKNFRGTDIVARVGGDEFAVVTHVQASAAEIAVARMDESAKVMIETLKRPYTISYSLGIASSDHGSRESFSSLIARADALMYEKKRQKKKTSNTARSRT